MREERRELSRACCRTVSSSLAKFSEVQFRSARFIHHHVEDGGIRPCPRSGACVCVCVCVQLRTHAPLLPPLLRSCILLLDLQYPSPRDQRSPRLLRLLLSLITLRFASSLPTPQVRQGAKSAGMVSVRMYSSGGKYAVASVCSTERVGVLAEGDSLKTLSCSKGIVLGACPLCPGPSGETPQLRCLLPKLSSGQK